MRHALAVLLTLLALASAAPAFAHGLLVQVRGEASAVTGRVYYSDGAPGAGEFVELRDLTEPARPVLSGATDPQGGFRFPGVPGHAYAVVVHGEEGHTTEMRLTLASGERGRLVDTPTPASAEGGFAWPPAWMLIGALLLLSTLPALWLRMRGR